MGTTVPCPVCRAAIASGTASCPSCGTDFSATTVGTGDDATFVGQRHSAPLDQAALRADLARTLGAKYTIAGELGRGGMGTVFDAWEPALERRVAIKVLSSEFGGDVTARARFLREAQSATAASAAPNTIKRRWW